MIPGVSGREARRGVPLVPIEAIVRERSRFQAPQYKCGVFTSHGPPGANYRNMMHEVGSNLAGVGKHGGCCTRFFSVLYLWYSNQS